MKVRPDRTSLTFSLSFSVALVMVLFSLSTSQYADAEFSDGDKREFVSVIEQIKGHLYAASLNHGENTALSELHLQHPLEEYNPQLDNLVQRQQTSENMELVLFMIKNIDSSSDNEKFHESIIAAEKLLDTVKESVVGEKDDRLNLLVINQMLELATKKYESGIDSEGSVRDILEVQNAQAFTQRANYLLLENELLTQSEKNEINNMFIEVFDEYEQESSATIISTMHDNIIHKINGIIPTINPEITEEKIPTWIKDRTTWWGVNKIDDKTFVQGIEYLIKEDIIEISHPISMDNDKIGSGIPAWVKDLSKWWSSGSISDDEFLKGITFLVESGIITVESI